MALRKEKKRTFGGHVYERTGQTKTTKSGLASLKSWAQFQRDVNGHDVRIVKENGGYEAYMRKGESPLLGKVVTIRTVIAPHGRESPREQVRLLTPRQTRVRVPLGDIVSERGRRHLRLY